MRAPAASVAAGDGRPATTRAHVRSVWRRRSRHHDGARRGGAREKRGAAKAELLPDVGGLDRTRALEILKPLFEDAEVSKTGHDLKNMAIVLARQGIKLRGLETDTILVSYVLDATRSDHRLEDLALEELTYRMTDEEEVRGKGVKALPFERVPLDAMLTYAGERADITWQLGPKLAGTMNAADLGPVYHELELPLVPVLIGDRDGRRARRRVSARAAGDDARSRAAPRAPSASTAWRARRSTSTRRNSWAMCCSSS